MSLEFASIKNNILGGKSLLLLIIVLIHHLKTSHLGLVSQKVFPYIQGFWDTQPCFLLCIFMFHIWISGLLQFILLYGIRNVI